MIVFGERVLYKSDKLYLLFGFVVVNVVFIYFAHTHKP